MMSGYKWVISTQEKTKPLGDLFGLFFEDLNHAADGGLYAELVQNRSFEFDKVDNPDYHALTAWEAIGGASLTVLHEAPLHPNNTHYLHLKTLAGGEGVRNLGFGAGIPIEKGKAYRFSCWAKADAEVTLHVSILNAPYAQFKVNGGWTKYETSFTAGETNHEGQLELTLDAAGEVCLDMVSLFPKDTFKGRENGLRADIAQALADAKPKFLRFPGGCLVHDGTLSADDRDSMYRWKNTIGPVQRRPARRSGWRYNQTLGLGFYEYFLLSEDIGAKPLPVLPGGCDPHHKRFAEGEVLQAFIQDALDLIEFANGGANTVWGAKRAAMGHPASFNLEYIGIGNEEVHQEFYDRLPLFVNAIRARYPDIKIIGSAGPFAAGGEYERGWQSARETQVDFVDEHYYQAPEWFIAHAHRYENYPINRPKVFLGEYASWGNTTQNALAEAVYMVGLQNAPAVGLACYAPMLCHVDYVNWRPDMIWFDNHRMFLTVNYHVQSLFMQHQGDTLLKSAGEGLRAQEIGEPPAITGLLSIGANDTTVHVSDIILKVNGEETRFKGEELTGQQQKPLSTVHAPCYSLSFKAKRLSGSKGLRVFFGWENEHNYIAWGIGGWENQDSILDTRVNGRGTCLTQTEFSVRDDHVYDLRLEVDGRRICTFIDGVLFNETEDKLPNPDALYYTASYENASGDLLLKAVNIKEAPVRVDIVLNGLKDSQLLGEVHELAGFAMDAKNSLDEPNAVSPVKRPFRAQSPSFSYDFPAHSVTVLRLHT